jgi:DNA-binding protein H-NS
VSDSLENLNEMDESQLRDLIKRAEAALRERVAKRLEELQTLAREAGYEVTLTKIGKETGGRGRGRAAKTGGTRRRKPVQQKYCNPDNPGETWSGRGRKPKWVEDALSKGRSLPDLTISAPEGAAA